MMVREIMTEGVQIVDPQTKLNDAAIKMRDIDSGILPVAENDRLVGMLSDRDITVRAVAEGRDPKETAVRDVMTDNVVYCFDDQDATDAAKIMEENQLRRLIVLNRDKRLVGICSVGDLAVAGDATASGSVLEEVATRAKAEGKG